MTNLTLNGRYGLSYPCTYHKENQQGKEVEYYFLNTMSANYVNVHYDNDTNLVGIDPEGLYIISIGGKFADKIITNIEPTINGYNIYIK